MKSGASPSNPWEKLFPRALALIDEISRMAASRTRSERWVVERC